MNCKKCGLLIEEDAKFCPYCGEKITKSRKKVNSDNTHTNKIIYADDLRKAEVKTYNNTKNLVGLILSILAIPVCFWKFVVGIILVIVGLVLTCVGAKEASKELKITSLIISIISMVIVFISSVVLFVASIEITLDNGYRVKIGDYFKGAFFNGFHSDEVQGYWITNENEVFYLDESTYALYLDENNFSSSYFTGNYTLEHGYEMNDDSIFEDDNYYYYTINTYRTTTDMEATDSGSIMKLLMNEIILMVDKDDFDEMILYFVDDNVKLELDRY